MVNTENIPKKKTKKIIILAGSILLFLLINGIEKSKFEFGWQAKTIEQENVLLQISNYCVREVFPALTYEGKEQVQKKYLGINTGVIGYQTLTKKIHKTTENQINQQTILWRNQKITVNTQNTGIANFTEIVQQKIMAMPNRSDSQRKMGIGDIFFEELKEENKIEQEATKLEKNKKMIDTLKENMETEYLIDHFYIVDSTTKIDKSIFDVKSLLSKDFSLKKKKKPQILIYHTHAATEAFQDSRPGKIEDTVVGVGSYLADILTDIYGYQVIHDETEYDNIGGKIDRNKAYNNALKGVEQILEQYPDIEVIIDLHRDAVNNNNQRVTEINGKKTAQIMLFNGLSRNQRGDISYLYNPNLQANLAFSLQLKLAAMEKYPDFTIRNYLKGYRYNLHLRERSLLIELGNENSTIEEAKNAMEPLAELLNEVLMEKE